MKNPLSLLRALLCLIIIAGTAFAGQTQYDSGDPSADEQLVLEIINRARKDPAAEGTRLNININEGLKAGVGPAVARPPLAMNKLLLAAARAHSQDMHARNYFEHDNPDGKDPFDRMLATGYKNGFLGENIAAAGSRGAAGLEDLLMVDLDYPERGHRVSLLNIDGPPIYREVGIGYFSGAQPNAMKFKNFLTQDFGNSQGSVPLVLGVVYDDKNGNNFYDIGEGLAGVTVTPLNGNFFAITGASGGYAFPMSAVGAVSVTASGGALTAPITTAAPLSTENVKIDFKAGSGGGGGPATAPKITSVLNSSGTTGTLFTYAIIASGTEPVTFEATGLPDGLTLSGSTISGLPLKAGAFVVTLTATNSAGKDTQSLTVTISAPPVGGGGSTVSKSTIDTDSDGFPDELEIDQGTSETQAGSTPFGTAPAGSKKILSITKSQFKLKFNAKTPGDSVTISGELPIPAGFVAAGKKVVIDAGGVIRTFILDEKNSAKLATGDTLKLKIKVVKKTVAAQTGTFTAKFVKGTFGATMSDEGLVNAEIQNKPVNVPVIVLFNAQYFDGASALLYTAKLDKSGTAK